MGVSGDAVPGICGGAVLEEGGEKADNFTVKAQFGEQGADDFMAHGREELGNVQGKDRGVESLISVFRDQVHENEAYIRGGMSANTPELAVVDEIMLLCFKLHSFSDNLGEEFADRI